MNFQLLQKIVYLYKRGVNVSETFKGILSENEFRELLKYVYDLQAGTYTKSILQDKTVQKIKKCLAKRLRQYLSTIDVERVCEAGIGEATSFSYISQEFSNDVKFWGFDISLSRLMAARKYLEIIKFNKKVNLFVGDLTDIPLQNSSMDLIYTVHAIEPNGGKEKNIISELYRCTSKYVILIEPDFERAGEEQKERMKRLGYVRNLLETLRDCGFRILDYSPLECNVNDNNKASIYFVEKNFTKTNHHQTIYSCPISKTPLVYKEGYYISDDYSFAYPTIENTPILLRDNAIFFPQEYRNVIDSTNKNS